MTRKFASLMVVAVMVVLAAPMAHAATPMPAHSSAFGASHVDWARRWSQWALGDASNPLIASVTDGHCGDLADGVFFMVAPIDVGLEFDCDIPAGTPIVFTHAAWITWIPSDGTTDAAIESAADAGFAAAGPDVLTLDGKALSMTTTSTGAFDVQVQAGSFFNAIIGIPEGRLRTALTGQFTVLHPLSPGDHVVYGAVKFAGGANGDYAATYHIHVG